MRDGYRFRVIFESGDESVQSIDGSCDPDAARREARDRAVGEFPNYTRDDVHDVQEAY